MLSDPFTGPRAPAHRADTIDVQLVVDGDSIPAGAVGNSCVPYMQTWSPRLASYQQVINVAVGGATIANRNTAFDAAVAPLLPRRATTKFRVLFLCGINNFFFGGSAADAWTDLQTYAGKVHALGGELYYGSPMQATSVSGAAETQRANFVTTVLANTSLFERFIQLDAVAGLTDPTNTTNFIDGIHLKPAGAYVQGMAIIAQSKGWF
jgi:hypothetical protein